MQRASVQKNMFESFILQKSTVNGIQMYICHRKLNLNYHKLVASNQIIWNFICTDTAKKYLSLQQINSNVLIMIQVQMIIQNSNNIINNLQMQQQQSQNPDQLLQNIPQSIITTFNTHLSQYKLQDNSNIDINTDIDEESLNKIINQLLIANGKQIDMGQPVLFDFLVGGKLLRGKIKSHLVRYQIGCEDVVEIQYFVAFREFDTLKQAPVQDWIAALAEVMGVDSNVGVISGLFDGSVAFHDKVTKKQPKIRGKIHEGPIKAIKVIPSEQQNVYYIFSGGLNEQLSVSKFSQDKEPEIISTNAHQGTIFAIDFNPILDGHICSAGSQGSLHVWKVPDNFLQDQTLNQVKTEKKKKRKTNQKQLPHLAQEQVHKDEINSLCWLTSSIIATGSSDHSIKATDIQKMKEVRTLLTKDSITTGIDYRNNSIFTSHEDGYIRSWDIRNNNSSPTQTFKSHSRFASCVRSHPHSNIFATGSYDQTVKIWDTRSVFPLQTIMTNYDKVFALVWKSQSELVSAGSNPYLSFHSL